jgi:pyridoxamine 5'-phosphate oxidase
MNQRELMNKLDAIIEDAKSAVLATSDSKGTPFLRWMTPIVLRWRPATLFCFTRPDTKKIEHIEAHPQVEWLIQNRALTEIVNVRGTVTVLDNPALKNEILEKLGSRLTMFWKVDLEKTEFVVLETIIQEATYYQPMKGVRETVEFKTEPARDE